MRTVAIVGGGASGLAAAIAIAETVRALGNRYADIRVVLFEAQDRVGKSILASGNGRCNFSNSEILPEKYWNADFVDAVLTSFETAVNISVQDLAVFRPNVDMRDQDNMSASMQCPNGVVEFFSQHGLLWREEGEGRLYPLANKASVVLDTLRAAMRVYGVEKRVGARIDFAEPPRKPEGSFMLHMADGSFERADVVVMACGGNASKEILPETLSYIKPTPVLGPIATNTELVRQLDNIRVKGALELWRGRTLISREVGEIMFRKYGVSGIAAFNLSRLMQMGDTIRIDFLPSVEQGNMEAFLAMRIHELKSIYGNTLCAFDLLRGMVLPQIAKTLLESMGISEHDPCCEDVVCKLATVLKGFELEVRGIGDVKQCQVHRGGFCVDGFDKKTLESRSAPRLFVTGEALDVDGPCGGYNLHWAFATGILAGRSAVNVLMAD